MLLSSQRCLKRYRFVFFVFVISERDSSRADVTSVPYTRGDHDDNTIHEFRFGRLKTNRIGSVSTTCITRVPHRYNTTDSIKFRLATTSRRSVIDLCVVAVVYNIVDRRQFHPNELYYTFLYLSTYCY